MGTLLGKYRLSRLNTEMIELKQANLSRKRNYPKKKAPGPWGLRGIPASFLTEQF